MRLKLVACKVLFREISLIATKSQNFIDVTYLRQGYHDEPETLKSILQDEIDRIDSGDDRYTCSVNKDKDFDAILLGYGLCSNGIAGISSKKYKIVVPKAHDCITLFLGSKERYKEYFDTHKGVYWYTQGWNECAPMPGKKRYELLRSCYVEQYGEDNADYLMKMEQGWMEQYNWCTFVGWSEFNNEHHRCFTRQCAQFLKWNYDELEGSSCLMADFLNGNWDDDRFLVVPPSKKIKPSYDSDIIGIED